MIYFCSGNFKNLIQPGLRCCGPFPWRSSTTFLAEGPCGGSLEVLGRVLGHLGEGLPKFQTLKIWVGGTEGRLFR